MPAEPAGQWGVLTTIALLLFVGVPENPHSFPIYVWLPDAMEGPTPSALDPRGDHGYPPACTWSYVRTQSF